MSKRHKVKQGEWLSMIARQYGFTKWQELWDHPENAALRAKRRNPFCLQPGDEVFIPDSPGTKVSAGASYLLQGGDRPDRFRLGLRRVNTPLSRRRYELKFGDVVHSGFLSFQGILDHPLPPKATEATLKVWTSDEPELVCEWKLQLGHLDPLEEISGLQGRLLNLGYYSGPINNELTEDTRTALANFQFAQALPPTVEVDATTLDTLEDRHEQNGGTELLPPSMGGDEDEPPAEATQQQPASAQGGGQASSAGGAPPAGSAPPAATGQAQGPGATQAGGGQAQGAGNASTAGGGAAAQGGGGGQAQGTAATTAGANATAQPTAAQPTAAQQSATAVETHRYGGFVLRRGDRDDQHRWGGAVQPVVQVNNGTAAPVAAGAGGTAGNALTVPAHVLRLQRDLRELGFLIGGNPDGGFGLGTEWAVREFQIYSKMENVAQENTAIAATQPDYVARLAQVQNTQRYTGAVSGVVNDATEQRIRHWLANRWRCPVVIRAMRVHNNNPTTVIQDNLWRHNDIVQGVRVYVRDFTGYYTMPAGRDANALHVLGGYTNYAGYGGPMSAPPQHTWPTSELLPSNLVGVATFQAMTAAQQSTYKVVRSASEQECLGFFDSLNAYDNAFVSLGPCHWTLGILFAGQAQASEGELCGFLSYLRSSNAAAFTQAIEFFGMRIHEDWNAGAGNGATLYDSAGKKYTGWPAQQNDDGTWARMARTEAAGNYYKAYHWYYRFQMAGRTIAGFQRAMWNAARIRIRDIRNTPWGAGVANVGTGAQARAPTIGDVVTSERGMGILMRWHIFRPGHVAAQNSAGTRLRTAFQAARTATPHLNWNQAPNLWGDAHEQAIVTHVLAAASAVNDTVENVANWPGWLGGTPQTTNPRNYQLALPAGTHLRVTRNSFTFDAP